MFCFFVSVSIRLVVFCLYVCLSVCVPTFLFFFYLSVFVPTFPCFSVYLFVFLSLYLSVCMCACLYVCLPVCLSVSFCHSLSLFFSPVLPPSLIFACGLLFPLPFPPNTPYCLLPFHCFLVSLFSLLSSPSAPIPSLLHLSSHFLSTFTPRLFPFPLAP